MVNIYYALSDLSSNANTEKGLVYGKEGLALAKEISWQRGIANLSAIIAYNYFARSDYPKAIEYWLKSLAIYEESGDRKKTATVLLNIGNVYSIQKNFVKAQEFYQHALSINEQLGDKENIAMDLASIGGVLLELKSFDKSLDYYHRALKINYELGDKGSVASNTGNIGVVYFTQKDYHRALAFYFGALHIAEELGDNGSLVINMGNIGECYYFIATDSGGVVPDSLVPAGRAANLQKSVDYLNRSVKLAKEIGFLNAVQEYSKYLADALIATGDFKGAIASYKQFMQAKDSVFNTENNIKITNLETQRELDLKDKQIEIDRLAVEKKRNERWFFIVGIAVMLGVTVNMFKNNRTQKKTNQLLSVEKKKSEDLLLNILPEEVAGELKEKGSTDARYFDNVSVLFTDFAGFTTAAEKMTPTELVGELHACFKAFDEILEKYNVEKIKTVGDAYLAVSGLPIANPQHAVNLVRAAKEMRDFILQRRSEMGERTFEMRIGIHSGSVVAGIVGVRKFAYDVWGDTVNMAARMEQNGTTGKINVSQSTYELIKDTFACEYRGEIAAKNKGMLKMYFVNI